MADSSAPGAGQGRTTGPVRGGHRLSAGGAAQMFSGGRNERPSSESSSTWTRTASNCRSSEARCFFAGSRKNASTALWKASRSSGGITSEASKHSARAVELSRPSISCSVAFAGSEGGSPVVFGNSGRTAGSASARHRSRPAGLDSRSTSSWAAGSSLKTAAMSPATSNVSRYSARPRRNRAEGSTRMSSPAYT